MRFNWCAAALAAVMSAGSFGWAQAQEFRPVSLEVIEAGVPGAPGEFAAAQPVATTVAYDCAAPVEPGCAAPACEAPATCDGNCCRSSGWYADVESVFLFADQRGHNAYVVLADLQNLTANQYDTNQGSLEDNMMVAPRTTIGFGGDCWGVQARYWSLNDTVTSFDPLLSVNFNDISGASSVDRLAMYTFDVEVTRKFCTCNWDLVGSIGARYADWQSDFRVTAIENIDIVNLTTASALAGTQFHGTGITGALQGYRQVSCCSGLGWFWNARASYLFGRHESFGEVTGASVDLTGSALSDNVAYAAADGNTFIGELQLGAQWQHELKCVNANAFIRVAGEYQYWAGTDVAQAVAVTTGATDLGGYFGTAEAGDPNMSLFGFTIGAGLNY